MKKIIFLIALFASILQVSAQELPFTIGKPVIFSNVPLKDSTATHFIMIDPLGKVFKIPKDSVGSGGGGDLQTTLELGSIGNVDKPLTLGAGSYGALSFSSDPSVGVSLVTNVNDRLYLSASNSGSILISPTGTVIDANATSNFSIYAAGNGLYMSPSGNQFNTYKGTLQINAPYGFNMQGLNGNRIISDEDGFTINGSSSPVYIYNNNNKFDGFGATFESNVLLKSNIFIGAGYDSGDYMMFREDGVYLNGPNPKDFGFYGNGGDVSFYMDSNFNSPVKFNAVNSGVITKTIGLDADNNLVYSSGSKFVQNVGDGVDNSYEVTHNLNDLDVIIQVREVSTNKIIDCEITINSENVITVNFTTIPTTDQFRVVIIK